MIGTRRAPGHADLVHRWWLLFLMVAALLCGCGGPGDGTAADPGRQQAARDALARYDRAVLAAGRRSFVPTGSLTGQVRAWTAADGAKKRALDSGRLVAAGALPAPRGLGTVVWARGGTQKVPLLSAGDALRQLAATASGDCRGCAPLEVVSARLGTTPVRTARGAATAPAWIYTLRGTPVRVTRVAVARLALVTATPPDPPVQPAGDVTVHSATIPALSSAALTVSFVGIPGPASTRCGADYTAEAVESPNAVEVVVTEHAHAGGSVACTAVGATRTAEVVLTGPLADRTILDGTQGLPVPVTVEN